MIKKEKKISGVQEWSDCSISIQYGCSHHCTYCWGEKMAKRFGRIPEKGWEYPRLKTKDELKHLPRNKKIMCFGTHDIDKNNLQICIQCINILLSRGNRVLIVSKPHLECIKAILENNNIFNSKNRIEFRFTIGTLDDTTREIYEPNAPTIAERFLCVKFLNEHGIEPSISCEPLLDVDINGGLSIVYSLLSNCRVKEIWIGALQYVKKGEGLPNLNYRAIYDYYKTNPKIKFKDSFFKQAKRQGVILP